MGKWNIWQKFSKIGLFNSKVVVVHSHHLILVWSYVHCLHFFIHFFFMASGTHSLSSFHLFLGKRKHLTALTIPCIDRILKGQKPNEKIFSLKFFLLLSIFFVHFVDETILSFTYFPIQSLRIDIIFQQTEVFKWNISFVFIIWNTLSDNIIETLVLLVSALVIDSMNEELIKWRISFKISNGMTAIDYLFNNNKTN